MRESAFEMPAPAKRREQLVQRLRHRLSYSNVTATLALFIALGGGAYAASTLHKNSVNSSTIKNGQVKTKDLAKNAVVSSKIKNGQVGAADVAPAEGFHLVGQPGEPAFGNGGQGDCFWSNFSSSGFPPGTLNPVSFYKDPYGRVHLAGVGGATNGPGGDGVCGTDNDDQFVFVLPPAYRPAHLELFPNATSTSNLVIVGGATDQAVSGGTLPAGAVTGPSSGAAVLDGISFRAIGPGNNLTRKATGGATGSSSAGSLPAIERFLK